MHIDHTTIRTQEIEQTKDFFIRVFDLKTGKRPDIIARNIPGYWLYADNEPIVHLIQASSRFKPGYDNSSEAIDHTAFFMTGYDQFRKKLDLLKIDYSPMELPDINEKRIFLRTPAGVLLETVFRNE